MNWRVSLVSNSQSTLSWNYDYSQSQVGTTLKQDGSLYWVEKPDKWHTVDLSPPTLMFLQENVQHHRPFNDPNLLMPTLGASSGPDVAAETHLSELQTAFGAMRGLFDRASLSEWITRPSDQYNTSSYHCCRITNDNALEMAGISTELVTWRLCQNFRAQTKHTIASPPPTDGRRCSASWVSRWKVKSCFLLADHQQVGVTACPQLMWPHLLAHDTNIARHI